MTIPSKRFTETKLMDILEPRNFHWVSYIRILSWVFRFINNINNKKKFSGNLSNREISDTKRILFRECQGEAFREEIPRLHMSFPIPQLSPLSAALPQLDAYGIIQSRKFPKPSVVLPVDSPIIPLLIRYYHDRSGHTAMRKGIKMITSDYWISNSKKLAHKWKESCPVCNTLNY